MKHLGIVIPEDLHEALKKVAAIECRSLHMQCLHTFYELVESYGFTVPITFENNQKIARSQKKKSKEQKLKDEYEELLK